MLAGFTALSVTWSLAPSDSWLETNRTFAYLATLAAGSPGAPGAVGLGGLLHGVALACVVVSGWALLTKVFPARARRRRDVYARLREPFDYWNAVGLMAALGMPPLLWLAARRSGHAALNALAWPGDRAADRLHDALLLARRAAGAGGRGRVLVRASCRCGCAGRSRSCGALVAAAPVVAWAFAQDALTTDRARSPRASTPGTRSARCSC